jgi:uncharacterized lipoprotein YmbA
VLAGCGTTAPVRFYALQPSPEVLQTGDRAGWDKGISVGMGPIDIPKYLERSQIAVVEPGPEVYYSERNRWAAPLDEGIVHVLVQNLGQRLSSDRVVEFEATRVVPVDYQVAIRIDRFDGVPGKKAVLRATWRVFGREANKPLAVRTSRIEEAAGGEGYGPLVVAQSRLLDALSGEMADVLKQLKPAAGAR